MSGADLPDVEFSEAGECALNTVSIGFQEVHSAEYRVDGAAAGDHANMGVALGLSLHSIFDGLAMAAAVASGSHGHGEALGLGTALAVILHKPFGALAITTLMAASGAATSSRHVVNLTFALVTPLGALLFYLGVGPWAHTHPAWLGCALAFCAGTFLCIACADLLPELQFHAHDRFPLSLALLVGLGVSVLIVRLGHTDESNHPATPVATAPVCHRILEVGLALPAVSGMNNA